MKKLFTLLLVAAISVTAFAQEQVLSVYKSQNVDQVHFPTKDDDGGEWIYWDKDNYAGNAIGTGGAAEFAVASRWDEFDLFDYDGFKITKMMIAAGGNAYATAEYTLKIWTGTEPTEVYAQEIDVAEGDAWLTYELEEEYTINGAEDLWFGYNVNTQTGHPAGCDEGPHVNGKGNKMFFQGSWQNLIDLGDLPYNWAIRAYIVSGNTVETLGGFNVNAYPNPFTNEITFGGDVSQVIIYNLIGQEVMNVNVTGTSVSTSDLSSGVYMVTFQNQFGERAVRKMIKQ